MNDSGAQKIEPIATELLPLEFDEKLCRVVVTVSKTAVDKLQAFPPWLIDDADRHMRRLMVAGTITHYEIYRDEIAALWNALLRVSRDVSVRIILATGLPKLTGLRFDTASPPSGCCGVLQLSAPPQAVRDWHPSWLGLYCNWVLHSHGQSNRVSDTCIEAIRSAYIRGWTTSSSFPVRERTVVNPALRDKDYVLKVVPHTGELEFVLGRFGVLKTPKFVAKVSQHIALAAKELVERPGSSGLVVCDQAQWLATMNILLRGTAQVHVDMPQTALVGIDRDALGLSTDSDGEYRLLSLILLYQQARQPLALDATAIEPRLTIKVGTPTITAAVQVIKRRNLARCFEQPEQPGRRLKAYVRAAWSSTPSHPLRGFAPTFNWGRMALEQLPARDRNIQVVMLTVRESQIATIQERLRNFHQFFPKKTEANTGTTFILSSQLTPITNIPNDDIIEGRDNEFDDGAMWVTMLLRELASLRDFHLSTEWVKRRIAFPIQTAAIERGFDALKRSGLLKLDPVRGCYVPSVENIATEDEITGDKVFRFHQTMIRFAEDVFRRYPHRVAQLSTTFLQATDDIVEARKPEINNFLDTLMSDCQTSRQADHVYQLNMQFYPLFRSTESVDPKPKKSDI